MDYRKVLEGAGSNTNEVARKTKYTYLTVSRALKGMSRLGTLDAIFATVNKCVEFRSKQTGLNVSLLYYIRMYSKGLNSLARRADISPQTLQAALTTPERVTMRKILAITEALGLEVYID